MTSTREKILKATFLLMLEKGYDNILVSDIQRRLGISRGLLYRYFKGKSELIFCACSEFFYNRFFDENIDYSQITLRQFLDYAFAAMRRFTNIDGHEVPMLKYNTLYSAMLQTNKKFAAEAMVEFGKARTVIDNAMRRGEIKTLPDNFVGGTILAIFGRTSYITEPPSNEYVCKRIVEDIDRFYDLIKK